VPLRRAGNSAIAYHHFSHVLCRSSRPRAGRRALRLDLPGAQVEVILRDHDLVLLPHVAVRLDRVRDQRHRTRPPAGPGQRPPDAIGALAPAPQRAAGMTAGPDPAAGKPRGQRAAGLPPGSPAAYRRP